MRHLHFQATRHHLRVGKHLVDAVDGAARHGLRLEGADPLGRRAHDRGLAHQGNQNRPVCHALRIGGEAFILRPFRVAGDGAKARELPIVADRQNHVAIGRREVLIRHDVRMRIAHALRHFAAAQVIGRLVAQRRHLHVEQGQVDMLAQARALAFCQRRLHGDGGVQARHDVRLRHAHFLWPGARLAIGHARDAHQAAHALDQKVIAGARRIRPILTEARDGAVHEARVECQQAGRVQTILLQAVHFEIFQQHVRFSRQLAHQRLALRGGQVDAQGALVAVGALEVGGLGRVAAVLVFQVGRTPGARVVAAARLFNLDHVGTEVGQHLPGPRAGQHARQVQHAQAGQRCGPQGGSQGVHQLLKAAMPVMARPMISACTSCVPS